MRTSSKSSFWAVAVLLSGAAAFGSACGGSGSDNRTGDTSTGGTGNVAGSSSVAGTSSSTGGAATCDSSAMCCPTLKCTCPYPQGDGTTDLISNADDGKNTFTTANVMKALGHWDFSRDASMGVTTPPANPILPVAMGANNTTDAYHVTGMNLTGWGAALAAEVNNGCPFDASKYGGITFYAKGTSTVAEGTNKLLVLVGNPEDLPKSAGGFCDDAAVPVDPACYARHRVTIDLTADWKQYTIVWSDLQPPSYFTTGAAFGSNRVTDVVFNASGPLPAVTPAASFDWWIDELSFVPPGTASTVSGGSSGGATSSAGGAAAAGTGGAAAAGTGGASGGSAGVSAN
jgi:hypothetical protein